VLIIVPAGQSKDQGGCISNTSAAPTGTAKLPSGATWGREGRGRGGDRATMLFRPMCCLSGQSLVSLQLLLAMMVCNEKEFHVTSKACLLSRERTGPAAKLPYATQLQLPARKQAHPAGLLNCKGLNVANNLMDMKLAASPRREMDFLALETSLKALLTPCSRHTEAGARWKLASEGIAFVDRSNARIEA